MALYYLDTSAVVKLYVREPGTAELLRIVSDSEENRLAISALSPVEVRSAVRRRERAGDVTPQSASFILDLLQQHLETLFILQAVDESVLEGASEMINRYALRAYDAVQLASCLAVKVTSPAERPTFVCADQRLLEAARSELLRVVDPCSSR